jgi:hypothetical protein
MVSAEPTVKQLATVDGRAFDFCGGNMGGV